MLFKERDDFVEDFELYEVEKNDKGNFSAYKSDFFDWIEILVTAIILLVVIFTFFFKIVTIDGPSMENTLHHGEKVIITDLVKEYKKGDIVVISRNLNNTVADKELSTPIIKRVIAIEGQTVNIDFISGVVYVDGVPLKENYVKSLTNNQFDIIFPVTVPENCVFVLGDNRNNSEDSRSSNIGEDGMIDTRYILGKAIYRLLPFDKFGSVE